MTSAFIGVTSGCVGYNPEDNYLEATLQFYYKSQNKSMSPKKVLTKLEANPKRLFIIDGIGAVASAFMLGIVLVRLESYIGIPPTSLYILAIIPLFFLVYDFKSYKSEDADTDSRLQGIAILNLLYCFLSIGFTYYHRETVTSFGLAYVVVEILIILYIVVLELKIAGKVKSGS